MLGLKCKQLNSKVNGALREHELLAVPAGDNVIRLLPPLNVTDEDIRVGLERVRAGIASLSQHAPEAARKQSA
jgi:acetylornithine/N-succinyldiaminopimelate aminotransferase